MQPHIIIIRIMIMLAAKESSLPKRIQDFFENHQSRSIFVFSNHLKFTILPGFSMVFVWTKRAASQDTTSAGTKPRHFMKRFCTELWKATVPPTRADCARRAERRGPGPPAAKVDRLRYFWLDGSRKFMAES